MKELIDRLKKMLLSGYTVEQINEIGQYLQIILHDYEITKRTTDIVVYSGDRDIEIIQKFLATKLVTGCSKRTITYYGTILKQFKQKIKKPILEVKSDDILYYLAIRNSVDNVTAVSQDNELRVFRSFYTWATVEELIDKNPTLKIKKIKGKKTVKKAFTETELELLRGACVNRYGLNKKHLAIIEVLISTGCRVSELCGMQIKDVEDDKIKVLGKGNKERYVYLTPRCQIALQNYLKERKDKSPYLFVGENIFTKEKSEQINPSSVESLVRTIAKRAGVEHAHPHKFRRTAATLALRKGMPIEIVSKMLGHEEIGTTQIYLEINESDIEQAHKKYC